MTHRIIPRSEWGAKRPHGKMVALGEPTRITIHHSGETAHEEGDGAKWVRSIQDYHMSDRGWSDISYHWLVDREGRIYKGRSVSAQGAHAKGFNKGNIGICLLGDTGQTKKQEKALKKLVADLCCEHGISKVVCHSDLNDTSCPGRVVKEWVKEINKGVE